MKKTYTRKLEDLMPAELNSYLFGEGSPQVFFTGGLHGGEATGIYVAEKVLAFLEENELLKGSVKVLRLLMCPHLDACSASHLTMSWT